MHLNPAFLPALLLSLLALNACHALPLTDSSTKQVRIDEASGLTQSILHPALYWTHNDSRNVFDSQPTEPLLFAINAQGELQGELWLDGIKPHDWEAISHFRQHDHAYLLIADIGDNRARRSRGIRLHAVREPSTLASTMHAQPAWTLELLYPDGARDAEALAVDSQENAIYILSKRDEKPQLYRAKLPKAGKNRQTLTLLGQIPPLNAELESSADDELHVLPFTHQPVDMAFAPDRQEVALLTYSHIYIFPRSPQQSWLQAMQGQPRVIPLPGARQYEGMSYSQDGQTLLVVRESSEYNRQAAVPVLRLARPADRYVRAH
ncbi:MAG: hypothetical protein AB1717_03915 [Pseudomonadota bacterium]